MISIPDHLEVTIRICLSLILTYVLTLGSYPGVIPPSQSVLIASIGAFTIVLPTLMFSIGAAVFPGVIMTACIALIISTILLAVAATGGTSVYIFVYFLFALILSGLRFSKEGGSAALLLMFISLNTVSLLTAAEQEGLSFVASLWTEKGTTNPYAAFRNTLIGICWICLCASFARLIPPARTARSLHSRMLLPKVLKDIATFIRLTLAYHMRDDIEDASSSEDGENDGENAAEENAADDKKMENIDDVTVKIIQDGSITIGGGVAALTSFEPRITRLLCHCGPPIDSPAMLNDLTNAVNECIFAALALRSFSKAGFKELENGGLKEVYEETAKLLDRCADELASMKQSSAEIDVGDTPSNSIGSPDLPFDPIMVQKCALKVKKLTSEWNVAMGPVDPSTRHFDNGARNAIVKSILPWIYGAGIGLLAAIMGCLRKAFSQTTWKRIFLPPYYDLLKFVWCLKFAVGFTILICMQVYWPTFANLEVKTNDDIVNANVAG
eukprot:scaffold46845_cov146-Skeletonema_marinoi.AAC.3